MGDISEVLKLLIALSVCCLVFTVSSLFVGFDNNYYNNLKKPSFAPPLWVFDPAGTTISLLIAISIFLVWRKPQETKIRRESLILFSIQLLLNLFWSFLFFAVRLPLAGFIDIVLLVVAVILVMISFSRTSKLAVILLLPYIIWLTFLLAINLSIIILN